MVMTHMHAHASHPFTLICLQGCLGKKVDNKRFFNKDVLTPGRTLQP